jgi:hypothetical protein
VLVGLILDPADRGRTSRQEDVIPLPRLFKRRPSAPLAISLVALFMSVGGVGYAATSLPEDSVGTAQIRDNAVTYKKIEPESVGAVRLATNGVTNSKIRNEAVSYKKIQPRAVGKVRANLDQLQARLDATCAAGTAVGGVDSAGKVTCNSARPATVSVAQASADVGATSQPVAAGTLPTGSSYLAFANPTVTVTGSGTSQRVTVSCTLALGTSTQTRTATVDTGGSTAASTVTIPLQQAGPAGAVSVACSDAVDAGTPPAVRATASIDALQTAG